MSEMMEKIRDRPVKFNALLHAVLGAFALAGFLTEVWIGAILLIVDSFLAFWLESYTTPVNPKTAEPRNPDYLKK